MGPVHNMAWELLENKLKNSKIEKLAYLKKQLIWK